MCTGHPPPSLPPFASPPAAAPPEACLPHTPRVKCGHPCPVIWHPAISASGWLPAFSLACKRGGERGAQRGRDWDGGAGGAGGPGTHCGGTRPVRRGGGTFTPEYRGSSPPPLLTGAGLRSSGPKGHPCPRPPWHPCHVACHPGTIPRASMPAGLGLRPRRASTGRFNASISPDDLNPIPPRKRLTSGPVGAFLIDVTSANSRYSPLLCSRSHCTLPAEFVRVNAVSPAKKTC